MNAPSTAELMLRMVISLAIMGGLAWLALKVSRGRKGFGRTGPTREPIEVFARRQLSRSTSLALVRVGEQTLLLSVAEGGARVLADGRDLATEPAEAAALALTAGAEPATTEAAATPTRLPLIDALRELTVRR